MVGQISAYESNAVERRINHLKAELYALGERPLHPIHRAKRLRWLLQNIRNLQGAAAQRKPTS
jgi:hypothetical protein